MPQVHDRVLLVLSTAGLTAVLMGGFLNYAPNRLARSTAYGLFEAPALDALATIAGLFGLLVLSLVQPQKSRSAGTILAAAGVLWGIMAGAASFASLLMNESPPAARVSLGPAFWILGSVAVLATADAVQRGNLGFFARIFIAAAFCAGFALMAAEGRFSKLSLAREFSNSSAVFSSELLRHLWLVFAAVFFALMIGVPLTVLILRKRAAAGFVFTSLGILQTIPSIALFGVLIAPLSKLSEQFPLLRDLGISGTGPAPAIIALTLYSLLPLVRSFHTGLSEVAPEVKEAAAAIGFGWRRALIEVDLPLRLRS